MLRQRRSRLVLITLTLVSLLFISNLVSIAAANPPTKEPLPAAPFTVTGKCDFDVLIEPLTNKEVLTTFFDKEGNERFFLITGSLKERLTNLSTGKSVDLNISGPLQLIPQPDGSQIVITLGAALYIFEPGVAPNLPLLALIHGRTVAEFDAAGNFTLLSVRGHVEDVCAALAAP